MKPQQLTFDQWAEAIGTRVLEAFPMACVKRKIEDVYRWTYHGRECQLHAVSDRTATFVTLLAGQRDPAMYRPASIQIDGSTEDEVVARIVGWFAR